MTNSAAPALERPKAGAIDRVERVDTRMLALTRCVLALSALLIIWIDPTQPQRLVELTYFSLAAFCLYSVLAALRSYRAGWPTPGRATIWGEVVFYVYLIALTEGTSSIFFFFFLFSILAASFSRGFREGLLVTVASTALFVVVGLFTGPAAPEFELNRTLIRPVYLFVLGYMIAHWGGYEIELRRRLRLLQDIGSQWNPRVGAQETISANLERLLEFYRASSCVLVLQRPGPEPTYCLYSAPRPRPWRSPAPTDVAPSTAEPLLGLPHMVGAIYHAGGGWRGPLLRANAAVDLETKVRTRAFQEALPALANLLEARAFVTVPYAQRDGTAGRIYLSAARDDRFEQSDLEFLAQASAAISLVVENMSLMEALISRAAENERLRISRDIHDTTIQPYIGLKLALDALQRDAGPDHRLAPQLAELVEMAGLTIRDLREYTNTLKASAPPGEHLVSAVRQQAERYGRFYGVEVEVEGEAPPTLTARLRAEAYQIISEGLSNVLRHTRAKRAYVSILCENANLLLKIGNEARDAPATGFTPRSIQERARALGGSSRVERTLDGFTVVQVAIPLWMEASRAGG